MTDAREAEQVLVARHWTRCVRVAHPIILFGGYEDRLRRFLPVVHLLGPTPDEYNSSQPVSFMCDDKTPVEIGWVFKSTGETSVQYAIEALSPSDGSPVSPQQNLVILQKLAIAGNCQGFDLSWTRKCTQSLLHPSRLLSHDLQRISQFFISKQPILFTNYDQHSH